jgi:hypothetical protein
MTCTWAFVTDRITASSIEHKNEKKRAKNKNPPKGIKSLGLEYAPSLTVPSPMLDAKAHGKVVRSTRIVKVFFILL